MEPQAPQVQPQAPAQAQPPQAAPQQPQGQQMPPNVAAMVEQHLNSLPDEQKQYVAQFMTPELAIIFGIMLGNDAFEYFKKYADPKKQLTVVQRQQNPSQQPAAQSGQQGVPMQPQSQPQAKVPARTIMGR